MRVTLQLTDHFTVILLTADKRLFKSLLFHYASYFVSKSHHSGRGARETVWRREQLRNSLSSSASDRPFNDGRGRKKTQRTALLPIVSGNERIFWFMREFMVIGPLFFCRTAWQQRVVGRKLT